MRSHIKYSIKYGDQILNTDKKIFNIYFNILKMLKYFKSTQPE